MSLTLTADAFWISPYTFSAFVALREKGLAFTTREVALDRGEHEAPEYRRHSVTGLVPMLDDGKFALAESSAIIDYLEERYPTPRILPASLEDRARARMVLAWIRSSRDLLPLLEERSTATMFYEHAQKPLSATAQESADKLVEVADSLIRSDRPTLFEGGWCIADSDLAFVLHRLILNGEKIPAKLRGYATEQWKRPSVREFAEHRRPAYVAY